MPAAGDRFRQGARILRTEADVASRLNQRVEAAFGPEVVSGGRLGDSAADFVANSGTEAAAIGAELDRLADEAEAKAIDADEQERAAAAASTAGSAV